MNRILLPLSIALSFQVISLQGASLVEPGAKVRKLAGNMKFTEGPVWLPGQNKVVFSDIPNSKLMQWSKKGGLSEFRKSEQANGNILDLQGRIISCQHAARNLIRIEKDGSTTVLADKFDGKRFNSPNDVAVGKDGTLWFTDPPWGLSGPHEIPGHWVYKLDPDSGKVEVLIKDLAMPNGIVFSPDGSRLYVADTGGHKRHPDPAFHGLAPSVTCYAVTKDRKLGKKLFKIDEGSDGMAVDVKGNLYLTHGQVQVYDANGKKLETIEVPEKPANVCFGGKDYKTLFITARTSLYQVRLAHAGAMSLRKK
ncbi:MAG: SMP-30/gluconolactonase/LRE family protein [Opitutae bacterium]|nr:SMP-30/gluconolactonase/LRE family protein [Opitutae bacterium]